MYIYMPVKCFYSSCAHLMFKKYAWNSELYLKLIVFLFDLACATVTRNFRITKGRTVGSIHQFPSERESSCSFLKSQRGTCTHYWSRWDFFLLHCTCILEFCYLYILSYLSCNNRWWTFTIPPRDNERIAGHEEVCHWESTGRSPPRIYRNGWSPTPHSTCATVPSLSGGAKSAWSCVLYIHVWYNRWVGLRQSQLLGPFRQRSFFRALTERPEILRLCSGIPIMPCNSFTKQHW